MLPEANQPAVAVYTSVFGDFEKVWPPLHPTSSTRYFLISDSKKAVPGWRLVHVDTAKFRSPRLGNRRQKMLFHETLDGVCASVYIDANVRTIAPLDALFAAFLASGADLGMYRHYARASVNDEARACIARDKVESAVAVDEELRFYESLGFPDAEGMWEGSVIFKNHQSPKLPAAMKEWWSLYSRFRTRDQFSLPFVIWKHKLTVFDLDEVKPSREYFFVRLQHSTKGVFNRLARYAQARAPENAGWKVVYGLAKFLNRHANRG